MQNRQRLLFMLALLAMVQVSPAILTTWELTPQGLQPAVLLPALSIQYPTRADFDQNGSFEWITLSGKHAAIASGEEILWQSPMDWQVLQAGLTDLNRDDQLEMTLLVWRPFQPWPVDRWLPKGGRIDDFHDANGNSCHLILIGWAGGKYREVWAGSALAQPVKRFAAADLNTDGKQELLTLEGSYADSQKSPARALKIWEWNGFGFSAITALEGPFIDMEIQTTGDSHSQILLEKSSQISFMTP